jgi:hypothetical protein
VKTENCIWFLLLTIILLNCGVRVTSNGKKIPTSSLPYVVDSTLVIGRFDYIKPGTSARLISVTRIRGPWQDLRTPALEQFKIEELGVERMSAAWRQRFGGKRLS